MPSRIELLMGVQPGDLDVDLVAAHERIFTMPEAELRDLVGRALRRAYLGEILAAWAVGEIGEGQAAALTGYRADWVGLREIAERSSVRVVDWWLEHRKTCKPLGCPTSTHGD